MSEEIPKPIEPTPRDKAAADYVNNTIFTDETGDDEALIKNMRFMAFSAGADWGAKAERERILKIITEVFQQTWDEGGYGRMDECSILDALLDDAEKRLKQRLGEDDENPVF